MRNRWNQVGQESNHKWGNTKEAHLTDTRWKQNHEKNIKNKQNRTNHYTFPLRWNRSIPTLCNGAVGTSATTMGYLLCLFLCFWHMAHLLSSDLMSLLILGQNSVILLLYFSMPKWPSYILCNMSILKACGMTILPFFNNIVPTMLSVFLTF